MKTNPEAYAERHRRFTLKAEEEFRAHQATNLSFTLVQAITGLAARVRLAIAQRDCVAGVLAAQCAHLAMSKEHKVAEIRIRAERRAGELVNAMEKAKGIVLNGRESGGDYRTSDDTRTDAPQTLEQLGISYDQSSQWQQLAAIPEEQGA